MNIKEFEFGKTSNGQLVKGITISNGQDIEFTATDRGATLISFKIKDKNGKLEECILGFDNIKEYEEHLGFYGATIGRVANRIAGGHFELEEKEYNIALNDNGVNALHGGKIGFDKVIWDYTTFKESDKLGIIFRYLSVDGEENFPGNLNLTVTFTLTTTNEFIIEYKAVTDKNTPVNLTNHAYWNLSGFNENVHNHNLSISADSYLPLNENNAPTGEIKSVESTAFNFRTLTSLGDALNKTGGFDHNFNLSLKKKNKPENRIYVEHPKSGRSMEILTTEPGVQLYTGFEDHNYLCLETQMYPDAVNKSNFDSIIITPEKPYHQITIHKFNIK